MNTKHPRLIFIALVALWMSCDPYEEDEYCHRIRLYSGEKPEEYQCPTLEEARRRWLGEEIGSSPIVSFESGPTKNILNPEELECCYQVKVDRRNY